MSRHPHRMRAPTSEIFDHTDSADDACALTVLARLYATLENCARHNVQSVGVDPDDLELDRMQDIAWQAAEIRAQSMQALAAKAEIFTNICQDLEADVAVRLGASLCEDVRNLEKRARSGAN
ncbi:MAG: hypothetical protein ACT4OU_04575 [Hyphomicrobium sp.]